MPLFKGFLEGFSSIVISVYVHLVFLMCFLVFASLSLGKIKKVQPDEASTKPIGIGSIRTAAGADMATWHWWYGYSIQLFDSNFIVESRRALWSSVALGA